jgi:hypothetical protein
VLGLRISAWLVTAGLQFYHRVAGLRRPLRTAA